MSRLLLGVVALSLLEVAGSTVARATSTVSINDVSRSEGDSGTTPFTFTVTLSVTSAETMSVQYATVEQSFAGVVGVAEALPEELSFAVAGANPALGEARFRFGLPEASHVHLQVHDVAGRLVASLVDVDRGAGFHTVGWSARGAERPKGIYFVRLTAGGRTLTRRIVLLE